MRIQTPKMRKKSIFLVICLCLSALALPWSPALATSHGEPSPGTIQQDEEHLKGVDGEVQSIAKQVAVVQQSLKEIEAKQNELSSKIRQLTEQSSLLLPQLQAKSAEYERRENTLMEAIDADYKTPRENAFFIVVGSKSVSDSLDASTYAEAFENKIGKLAEAAGEARDSLDDRKKEIDSKRSSLEVYQREQLQLRLGAEQQRAELKELLDNRANEAAYLAEKIAKAKMQQDVLLKAAAEGANGALWGTYTAGAAVKQGDVIGLEGSTGNSTGCHTHFSSIQAGKWVNPKPLVDIGMLRNPDGSVTQPYGMTDYARSGAYGGNIHNGIDVVQGCGAPVRAAADGIIIRDNRTDGSGFGHYVMIRHTNGLITLYGHLI